MIIALVSNKGGVGKTTLSMNVASGLNRRESTGILDADPQQSSTHWARVGNLSGFKSPDLLTLSDTPFNEQVKTLADKHRYVIIDCPPSIASPETHSALRIADVAIVPVQPSPVDLWATVHIASIVKEAHQDNPNLKALLALNQLEPRTTLSRVMQGAMGQLGLPVLLTPIKRRAVYRNCLLDGRTVYDCGVRGTDAIAEIEAIIEEVIKL